MHVAHPQTQPPLYPAPSGATGHQAKRMVGMAFVPDGAAATTMAAVGVLSGVLMGVGVGAVTGVVFVCLMLPRHAVRGSTATVM